MFNSNLFSILAFVLSLSLTRCDCPAGYEEHPLVLVSMDGFRYDYIPWAESPRIDSFRQSGVSSPFMKASYPTITFPNHYAIVTGLYPESHGIIANHFYDPEFDDYFEIGTNVSLEAKWWGGDPAWNTVVNQGKKSATMFWPGSDALVENMHPTYWYPYDDDYPFELRVTQVLDWLAMPVEDRPIFISLYFNQPDHNGHLYGPFTQEVYDAIENVDQMFGDLIDGIAAMNLTDCVNIVLISDHGMASVGHQGSVQIYDYVPDITNRALVYDGVLVKLYVYDSGDIDPLRQELTCNMPHMQQYIPSTVPTRMHYSNNIRTGDISLEMNLGYEGFSAPGYYESEGNHGYDNYYPEMQPIFMASGPEFINSASVEEFQNIELYNLLCLLSGVNPSPNNGTLGTLYRLLQVPPQYPDNPQEPSLAFAEYPATDADVVAQLHNSGCVGDLNETDVWMSSLDATDQDLTDAEDTHLPWGNPLIGDLLTEVSLLYHQDHITGYSTTLKMPLWTSFTLESTPFGTPKADWSSDFRLNQSVTATCDSYESLKSQNITMQPLFPNKYSFYPSLDKVPFLTSNAVPMSDLLKQRWELLMNNFIDPWLELDNGPINVVIGPVFDLDADSLVDNFNSLNNDPVVPSHVFLMATRCNQTGVASLNVCQPQDLDALAFIYPQQDPVPNCLTSKQYRMQYAAKVKDVELATGLLFNTKLEYKDRILLETRMPTALWI